MRAPGELCSDRTGGGRYQCLMPAGHGGPHCNGLTTWSAEPSSPAPEATDAIHAVDEGMRRRRIQMVTFLEALAATAMVYPDGLAAAPSDALRVTFSTDAFAVLHPVLDAIEAVRALRDSWRITAQRLRGTAWDIPVSLTITGDSPQTRCAQAAQLEHNAGQLDAILTSLERSI